jgi:esterase/lipase superfamily enzyme
MKREHHCWFSPVLQRDMELLIIGHGGARVLVFPPAQGRCCAWEDHGMVAALQEPIGQGDLQLYCVDSVDAESWHAASKPPAERVRRHVQYDRYILSEVLLFSAERNPKSFLIVTGADFGGYHAVNFAFRHPHLVGRVLGMSGVYDIKPFTDDYHDDNVYFNNPCDFIIHEHEAQRLDALRRLDIILTIGRDDPNRANNEYLSSILWSKGIGNALRIWDGPAHDWPTWQQMLRLYIGGHD